MKQWWLHDGVPWYRCFCINNFLYSPKNRVCILWTYQWSNLIYWGVFRKQFGHLFLCFLITRGRCVLSWEMWLSISALEHSHVLKTRCLALCPHGGSGGGRAARCLSSLALGQLPQFPWVLQNPSSALLVLTPNLWFSSRVNMCWFNGFSSQIPMITASDLLLGEVEVFSFSAVFVGCFNFGEMFLFV